MNIEKKKTSPALFVRQVRQELQKVTWPQRRDTFISSAIVILLIILFSLFSNESLSAVKIKGGVITSAEVLKTEKPKKRNDLIYDLKKINPHYSNN